MNRRQAISTMTLPLILLAACGVQQFATTFRVVVAAGAPILTRLEQQGKITHDLHVILSSDLTAEATQISAMAGCFDGILKDDPQSRPKHLQCVQTLASSPATKKLLSDFGGNGQVSVIADDFDAILQAAILYYGGNGQMPSVAGATRPSITEEDVKARVKKLKVDLGQGN